VMGAFSMGQKTGEIGPQSIASQTWTRSHSRRGIMTSFSNVQGRMLGIASSNVEADHNGRSGIVK